MFSGGGVGHTRFSGTREKPQTTIQRLKTP